MNRTSSLRFTAVSLVLRCKAAQTRKISSTNPCPTSTTREVEDDLAKSFEARGDASRLRARHESVSAHEQLDDDARLHELEVDGVFVEHLSKRSRGLGAHLEPHTCAASGRRRSNCDILPAIVHDPSQAAAIELESIGDLGGKENPLAGMALRQRGDLTLAQLFDRFEVGRETELSSQVRKNPDSLVDHLESEPAGMRSNRTSTSFELECSMALLSISVNA